MQVQSNTTAASPSRRRTERRQAPTPYDATQMLIGGMWRAGRSGKVAADRNPYTGETLVQIGLADASDVDDAYVMAENVQRAWAAVPPQERRTLFERAARLVKEHKAEIIDWLIREAGSTHAKANFEWQLTHLNLLEVAGHPTRVTGRTLPSLTRGKESRVYRRPVGVVGVISPWNFPLHLTMRSVAPALALGNTVVLKPASETPVTGGLLIARIFEEAGLPPEVLSVVVGNGEDIGDAFVDHPAPRVIAFTGSTIVGRHIAARAGRGVKRVCLELGGNTPFIVLEDADLERAAAAAVAGKFLHQGQICIAINRILVHERRHDEFVHRFLDRVASLEVGDPSDPYTAIGPIINRAQFDAILEKIEGSIRMGARVLLRDKPSGLVLPPIVLDDVTNDMPVAREETFGPVAPILRFSDDEEAIRIANDTDYGLASAIFTRDVRRGVRMAQRIESGTAHVNDWPINDEPNAPFGGEKWSGIGRLGGEWAIQEFTTDQWITVQDAPRTYPI
jgi:aldehyde dehydrogenase (NAD+)